jgi:hypothetical protein
MACSEDDRSWQRQTNRNVCTADDDETYERGYKGID